MTVTVPVKTCIRDINGIAMEDSVWGACQSYAEMVEALGKILGRPAPAPDSVWEKKYEYSSPQPTATPLPQLPCGDGTFCRIMHSDKMAIGDVHAAVASNFGLRTTQAAIAGATSTKKYLSSLGRNGPEPVTVNYMDEKKRMRSVTVMLNAAQLAK